MADGCFCILQTQHHGRSRDIQERPDRRAHTGKCEPWHIDDNARRRAQIRQQEFRNLQPVQASGLRVRRFPPIVVRRGTVAPRGGPPPVRFEHCRHGLRQLFGGFDYRFTVMGLTTTSTGRRWRDPKRLRSLSCYPAFRLSTRPRGNIYVSFTRGYKAGGGQTRRSSPISCRTDVETN